MFDPTHTFPFFLFAVRRVALTSTLTPTSATPREAAVESLHQAIQDAGLTPRQNRELEECIRGRFTVSSMPCIPR